MQNTSSEARPSHSTGMPRVALIAAVAANGVIGDDNRLPWRLAADLKHFRALTTGHAVIMGRKTWESLPRVLPDRQNIVVTRQRDYAAAGAEIAGSFDEALALVRLPEPAFCIGGAELYSAALPHATTLYLTQLDRAFDGDVRFPALGRDEWRETHRAAHSSDGPDGFGYAFVTFERASPAD
jgi:dihydrofolate reductase